MIGLLRTSVTRWEEAEPARCDYDQAETATKLAGARLDATKLNMVPMIRLCSVAQARFHMLSCGLQATLKAERNGKPVMIGRN